MKAKEVFDIKDEIDLRRYQIISKQLFKSKDETLSIFSFDKGESVSEQANSEDILILVLDGKMSVNQKETFTASNFQVLAIPKNTLHRVYSNEQSKVLQLSLIVEEGEKEMENFINKINHGEILNLSDSVEYQEGGITSIALVQRKSLTLTLFAIDKGQSLATHSSNGDAMVQVIDGSVLINIDGTDFKLSKGQSIIMPAGAPHSLKAEERFKMMLTVVKPL